jgi:hypothetical protein
MGKPTERPDKNVHSEHSPSSLKHLEICPYYVQTDREEEEDEHQMTTDGTAIHNWVELELMEETVGNPVDPETEADWRRVENDPELRRLGQWCLDVLDSAVMPFADGSEPKRLREWTTHLERRVHTPFPTCYGRADVILEDGEEAHIVDWKTGFKDQGDAEENIQGQAYVLGVFRDFNVTKVTVWFVYPRVESITYAEYEREEQWPILVDRVGAIVSKAIRAKMVVEGKPINGDAPAYCLDVTNCEYCDRKGACPAWVDAVTEVMEIVPPAMAPAMAPGGLGRPRTWDLAELVNDPIEMAKVVTVMDGLDDYRKAVRALALMMANEKGMVLPGYKCITMSGKLSVINPAKAMEGLTPGDIAEISTISAPKLAKVVAAKKGMTEPHARAMLIQRGVCHPGHPFAQLRKVPKPHTPKLKK